MRKLTFVWEVAQVAISTFLALLLVCGYIPEWTDFLNQLKH